MQVELNAVVRLEPGLPSSPPRNRRSSTGILGKVQYYRHAASVLAHEKCCITIGRTVILTLLAHNLPFINMQSTEVMTKSTQYSFKILSLFSSITYQTA